MRLQARRTAKLGRMSRKAANHRDRDRVGQGFASLASEIVELAIQDFRTLSDMGVIVDGRAITDEEWPKNRNGYGKNLLHYYRSNWDVKQLIEFFNGEDVDFTLQAAGLNVDGARLRRAMGIKG